MITEGTVTISMRDFKWLEEMAKAGQELKFDYNNLIEAFNELEEENKGLKIIIKMAQQQGGNL